MSHILTSRRKQNMDLMHGRPLRTYRRNKDAERILAKAPADLRAQILV
jgi:hypothetical protein